MTITTIPLLSFRVSEPCFFDALPVVRAANVQEDGRITMEKADRIWRRPSCHLEAAQPAHLGAGAQKVDSGKQGGERLTPSLQTSTPVRRVPPESSLPRVAALGLRSRISASLREFPTWRMADFPRGVLSLARILSFHRSAYLSWTVLTGSYWRVRSLPNWVGESCPVSAEGTGVNPS